MLTAVCLGVVESLAGSTWSASGDPCPVGSLEVAASETECPCNSGCKRVFEFVAECHWALVLGLDFVDLYRTTNPSG